MLFSYPSPTLPSVPIYPELSILPLDNFIKIEQVLNSNYFSKKKERKEKKENRKIFPPKEERANLLSGISKNFSQIIILFKYSMVYIFGETKTADGNKRAVGMEEGGCRARQGKDESFVRHRFCEHNFLP